jgi:hypothetical protein
MKLSLCAGLLLGVASVPLSAQALAENTPVKPLLAKKTKTCREAAND